MVTRLPWLPERTSLPTWSYDRKPLIILPLRTLPRLGYIVRTLPQYGQGWGLHVNSLWPGDAIWWLRTGWALAQVMALCLIAPGHYLNHCWLISEVLWHSFTWGKCSLNSPNIIISILDMSWKIELENWLRLQSQLPVWPNWVSLVNIAMILDIRGYQLHPLKQVHILQETLILTWINLIPVWISNHMLSKVWVEIT